MGKLAMILVLLFCFLGFTAVVMYFIYDNHYVSTENLYKAQVSQDQIVYDEVWKVIQQQAGITENYSESFRENYTKIMSSRNYGGEMMKWITEQNPNFTPELHQKLMTTIEVQRAKFTMVQSKLISIHMELENMLTMFPSRFFLVTIAGHVLPDLKIVTSTRTDNAFETGKDDDVQLFQKKDTAK